MGELLNTDGHTVKVQHPWLRWENEGNKPFAAFQIYCGLGAERTCIETAKRCNTTRQCVDRWCHRWNWRERVRAYDSALAQECFARVSQRLASQADKYSALADAELARTYQLDGLGQAIVCSKVSAELAGLGKLAIEAESEGSGPPPILVMSVIPERPEGFSYVRMSDEPLRWTWIPLEHAPRVARERPDWLVVA